MSLAETLESRRLLSVDPTLTAFLLAEHDGSASVMATHHHGGHHVVHTGHTVKTDGAAMTAPVIIGPGTAAAPGTISAPGATLTTSTPTFTWNAVTGVNLNSYQLNLFDKTSSKFFSYQVASHLTRFTLPAGVLTPGHEYVWNLRLRAGSKTGPESAYFCFQAPGAAAPLTAPTILNPGTTAKPGPVLTTSTPTLAWDAVSGESFATYQINLFDTTSNKFFSYQVANNLTSFTVPAGVLTPGHGFVWNLRLNTGSKTGPESAYFYFQTPGSSSPLTSPTILSPGTTAKTGTPPTAASPTFTWSAVTGENFATY